MPASLKLDSRTPDGRGSPTVPTSPSNPSCVNCGNLSDGRSYGTDQLAHTETVVLIDRHRRIRGVYNGTLQLDVERLRDDIAILVSLAS